MTRATSPTHQSRSASRKRKVFFYTPDRAKNILILEKVAQKNFNHLFPAPYKPRLQHTSSRIVQKCGTRI